MPATLSPARVSLTTKTTKPPEYWYVNWDHLHECQHCREPWLCVLMICQGRKWRRCAECFYTNAATGEADPNDNIDAQG